MYTTTNVRKAALGHMLTLTLANKPISTVPELKILGITFSNDLEWQNHHFQLRKKVNRMISVKDHFGRSLNIYMRKKVVHAFIIPHVTNCLPEWGNSNPGKIALMNCVLERITRFTLKNYFASVSNIYAQTTNIYPTNHLLFYCTVCCLSVSFRICKMIHIVLPY